MRRVRALGRAEASGVGYHLRMRALPLALPLLLAAACAPLSTAHVIKKPAGPLAPPKTVVFIGTGEAKDTGGVSTAVFVFGEVLRSHGFEVKRFAKDDGSTPYGLELKGGLRERCPDGGFGFSWLEVYVVDLRRNEQVMAVGGDGYTARCMPPAMGEGLFEQLAKLLGAAWSEPTPAAPSPAPTSSL